MGAALGLENLETQRDNNGEIKNTHLFAYFEEGAAKKRLLSPYFLRLPVPVELNGFCETRDPGHVMLQLAGNMPRWSPGKKHPKALWLLSENVTALHGSVSGIVSDHAKEFTKECADCHFISTGQKTTAALLILFSLNGDAPLLFYFCCSSRHN